MHVVVYSLDSLRESTMRMLRAVLSKFNDNFVMSVKEIELHSGP